MQILIPLIVSVISSVALLFGSQTLAPSYGTAITTINGSDRVTDSRTVINDNFTALLNGKLELSDWYATTSKPNLVTVGTITTGVWNGTAIGVGYGGTGTTSPSLNYVMLGNGSSGLKTVSGLGSSGQFLTSNGAGNAPTWQSATVNENDAYDWAGLHTWSALGTFNGGLTSTATTTLAGSSLASNAIVINTVPYQFPSSGITASTTWGFNAQGIATYWPLPEYRNGYAATSTNPKGTQNIAHNLGRTPKKIRMSVSNNSANSSPSHSECVVAYNGYTFSSQCRRDSDESGTISEYYQSSSEFVMWANISSDLRNTATVTFDATNIILNWTSNGDTPNQTIYILWEAE